MKYEVDDPIAQRVGAPRMPLQPPQPQSADSNPGASVVNQNRRSPSLAWTRRLFLDQSQIIEDKTKASDGKINPRTSPLPGLSPTARAAVLGRCTGRKPDTAVRSDEILLED